MALFLTFLSGLFFLVGAFIYKLAINKENFSVFSLACSFVVLVGLVIFDLIPELWEMKEVSSFLFILSGLLLLLFLDKLIPHHHHEHKEVHDDKSEHDNHLIHISRVTVLALLLHNVIEAMGLYSVTQSNIKSGVAYLLAIGLHNVPLGFQIYGLSKTWQNKVLIGSLVFSGLLGGLIFCIFGEMTIFWQSAILSITVGMIIYILVFELMKEVWHARMKKEVFYGIMVGVVLLLIINII